MDEVNDEAFGFLFNSRLEAGIRAVVILEALRPTTADLTEMVLFDYVVVHTADLGGPPSLHAAIPNRKGELLVRRRLVEASLDMMRRCHLVEQENGEGGLMWQASDEAAAYVELLESTYSANLKHCADWLAAEVKKRGKPAFRTFVHGALGDWTEAFSPAGGGSYAQH